MSLHHRAAIAGGFLALGLLAGAPTAHELDDPAFAAWQGPVTPPSPGAAS